MMKPQRLQQRVEVAYSRTVIGGEPFATQGEEFAQPWPLTDASLTLAEYR